MAATNYLDGARAKENAPSILFFDEMDGPFPTAQGPVGQHDVQLVEQALIEISALKPEHNVFLVGTTNYPDRVDSRILCGGRFSEKIEIGVPDEAAYGRLLTRYLGKAQLEDQQTLRASGRDVYPRPSSRPSTSR